MTIRKSDLIVVLLLAFVIRLGWVAGHYTESLAAFQHGDYTLYLIGAEAFAQQGNFSNSLFLVRPPLFPLLIYSLNMNGTAVLLVNTVFGALLAPLSMVLAWQFGLTRRETLVTGLIVAFDPTSIVYSGYLGPEPLANVTLLVALIALLVAIDPAYQPRLRLASGVAAGIGVGLSMLARPASFLLFIPLGIWLLIQRRRAWRAIVVFMVISGMVMGGWILHNGQQFATYSFSTIGTYNLLYYRASSVERLASGQPIDTVYAELSRRVEEQLGHDTDHVTDQTRHGHYAATSDTQRAMMQTALAVFRSAPGFYIITIPIGLARMFLITNVLPGWFKPLDVVWNAVFILGALAGLWIIARRRKWLLFGYVVLLSVYYTGGTLVVQTSGMDTRMRTMLTPFLAMATAISLFALIDWWCERRRPSIRADANHATETKEI